MKVGAPSIITGRPKAILFLRFQLFYVWCCSIFKWLNFNTSVFFFFLSDLFGSVKMAESLPVWEKAADSAFHV